MSEDIKAVQLLARGVQDVWLTGDPQVSFYRSTYRRHEQFAADTILHHVPLSGTVSIQRKGDLLGYMFLTAHDSNGTLVPGLDWSALIDKIDLVIGRQTICSHDIQYINTIRGVLEASNWSQRFRRTEFQPLGFFTDTWPLPLSTLKYTEIDVVISIKSQAYRYRLWTQQIFLSESERKWFDTTTHRLLIPQVQRLPVTNEPSFHGPIKYIAWPSVNYSNMYLGRPLAFMTVNGSGNDGGYSPIVDSVGNIYISGTYTSTTVVPINNLVLNSTPVPSGYTLPVTSGGVDVFILKYGPNGIISSFMTLNGTGDFEQPWSIIIDSVGNIYVYGNYNSSTVVPINNMGLPQSVSGYTLPATSDIDIFLLKYAPDGTISSFTTLKGTIVDQGFNANIDSFGNIYVTGYYTSSTVVPINNMALNSTPVPSAYTLPVTIYNDTFLLKYAPDGTISSFTTLKGNSFDRIFSSTIDLFGNIYVIGYYTSSTVVPINNMALNSTPVPSAYTLPATSGSDVFLLKYASDGTISSFTTLKGTGDDIGYSIVVDSNQNVYITGYYNSGTVVPINNMALNSTPVPSGYTLPVTSRNDMFVLKYASDGTISSFTTLKGTGDDIGYSIVVDSNQNVYITGYYNSGTVVPINNMALNSTPVPSGYTLPVTSGNDIFLLKYAPDGTISSFTTLKGTGGDRGQLIFIDSYRNIYLSGFYNSTTVVPINNMTLNNTLVPSGYTLPVTSGNDMFLIKYGPN